MGKAYCNKIQISDVKGWSPVLESEIANISAKIAELTRLRGRLYEYKFNKNKEGNPSFYYAINVSHGMKLKYTSTVSPCKAHPGKANAPAGVI